MRFNIDTVYNNGKQHIETLWVITEYDVGQEINTVTYEYVDGYLLSAIYDPVNHDNVFEVVTTRKYDDGTTETMTDIVSLGSKQPQDRSVLITPKVKVIYDTKNTDKDHIIFRSDVLKSFEGTHIHMSSDWIIRDTSGVIVYQKLMTKSLTSISIPSNVFIGRGVLTIEVIYRTTGMRLSYRGITEFRLDIDLGKSDDEILVSSMGYEDRLPTNTINYFKLLDDISPISYSGVMYITTVLGTQTVSLTDSSFTIDTIDLPLDSTLTIDIHLTPLNPLLGPKKNISVFKIVSRTTLHDRYKVKDLMTFSNTSILSTDPTIQEFNDCDTIELINGTIPVLDIISKRIHWYYLIDTSLVISGDVSIQVENVESNVQIIDCIKIRHTGNNHLIVTYQSKDIWTSEYYLTVKVFQFIISEHGVSSDCKLIKEQAFPLPGRLLDDSILISEVEPNIIQINTSNRIGGNTNEVFSIFGDTVSDSVYTSDMMSMNEIGFYNIIFKSDGLYIQTLDDLVPTVPLVTDYINGISILRNGDQHLLSYDDTSSQLRKIN